MDSLWEWIEHAGKIFFSFGLSSLLGGLFGFWFVSQNEAEAMVSVIEKNIIPVITFERIDNGVLYGNISEGEVRFVLPNGDGTHTTRAFEVPLVSILPMLKMLPAPSGMQFVASKAGKKYYPLDSPSAFLLSPKNRVFYRTAEEAEKDGKTR